MSDTRPTASTVPRPRASRGSEDYTHTSSSSRPFAIPASPPNRAGRPSIPMSPSIISTSLRSVPVPVPQRHGSLSIHTHPRHSPHNSLSALPDGISFIPRSISPGPFLPSTSPVLTSALASMTAPRRQSAQGSHHRGASSNTSLASLFAPSSAGTGTGVSFNAADEGLKRAKSDRRRSVVIDGLKSDLRRSSTKESLLNLGEDEGEWLEITGKDILERARARCDVVKVINEDMGMEEAVEIMIQSNYQCLLVQKRSGFAFFDYADLNTFLLLVLHATSASPSPSRHASLKRASRDYASESAIVDDTVPESADILDERSKAIVARLRKFEKVPIGSVCDISGKDPYHAFPSTTPLRTLLPLFASGLHKIALTSTPSEPPKIVTDLAVIEHLVSLPVSDQPTIFTLAVTSSQASFPLHPLISLPGTASVLDAMQIMSINGLSALGVLSGAGSGRGRESARRQSSGSSGSSSGALMFRSSSSGDRVDRVGQAGMTTSPLVSPSAEMLASPFDQLGMGGLTSVVTVKECTRVVVPSEGKQVLGMGLEEMVKKVQYVEEAGRDRGEERVPVHTVPYNSTILHAAHLILATSSSRVFLRPPSTADALPGGAISSSPPLSPAPSLTMSQSSPPSSPSLSSLNLSDARVSQGFSTLPIPPPTQLSTHYVVSTLDILSCLARAYHDKLTPPAGVHRIEAVAGPGSEVEDPAGTRKRRERDRLRGSIMIPAGGEVGGWGLDPAALRRRRQSSFVSPVLEGVGSRVDKDAAEKGKEGGFERWRWAGRVDRS